MELLILLAAFALTTTTFLLMYKIVSSKVAKSLIPVKGKTIKPDEVLNKIKAQLGGEGIKEAEHIYEELRRSRLEAEEFLDEHGGSQES